MASQAATLGDIKQARNEAARAAERRERKEESECENVADPDRLFSAELIAVTSVATRTKDYRELHDQVEVSGGIAGIPACKWDVGCS